MVLLKIALVVILILTLVAEYTILTTIPHKYREAAMIFSLLVWLTGSIVALMMMLTMQSKF